VRSCGALGAGPIDKALRADIGLRVPHRPTAPLSDLRISSICRDAEDSVCCRGGASPGFARLRRLLQNDRVGLIELTTFIKAPRERCFDLSLSVELHLLSAAGARERVVAGPDSGILVLGDVITWEAHHLGFRKQLTVEITALDRPRSFRDEMIEGPTRTMRHDHLFEVRDGGTQMLDRFEVSMMPVFDAIVLRPHLTRFLTERNDLIRRTAESEEWRRYLGG
jgi:ligand-binding SRPBCC domain-containing protein